MSNPTIRGIGPMTKDNPSIQSIEPKTSVIKQSRHQSNDEAKSIPMSKHHPMIQTSFHDNTRIQNSKHHSNIIPKIQSNVHTSFQ